MYEEQPYLDLLARILSNGNQVESRNGPTFSVFGHHMEFSLKDNTIPLLTTKKVAWKTCFRELMWFLRARQTTQNCKPKMFAYGMPMLPENS